MSSNNGAAFEDICSVIRRRWPLLRIKLFASSVQGLEAPKQLIKALKAADSDQESDCILISRGGGSLEDLFCFNDEQLARQIFNCQKPVISGVGHEIDHSICDFVADVRAATPSAAAELLTPDCQQVTQQLTHWQQQLCRYLEQTVNSQQQRLANLGWLLKAPSHKIQQTQQQLEHLVRALHLSSQRVISSKQQQLHQAQQQIDKQEPQQKIKLQQAQLKFLQTKLISHLKHNKQQNQHQFKQLLLKLDSLSPLNTLKRGYAISKVNDKVITSVAQLSTQQRIHTQFSDGEVISTIEAINNKT